MIAAVTRVVAFGAYDTRKPRVRLLLAALQRSGRLADDILIPAWDHVAQTNVPSKAGILRVILSLMAGYPHALWRLLRSPRGAAILLPYPGIIEVVLIAPLAWALRRQLVLDAFLPIHDTIINDRAMVRSRLLERAIWWAERTWLRLADWIVVDTDCHGDYFAAAFGIPRDRFITVLVGAEPQFDQHRCADLAEDILGPVSAEPIILFYGQLIPLHGVSTIIAAARLSAGVAARWVIIGRGQLEPQLQAELAQSVGARIEWIPWVDYARLPAVIARASVCLGVFGQSDKAGRVIPNKLFQQLAVGKPVITRASPAVDALARAYPQAVVTVPPGDPEALAAMVADVVAGRLSLSALPAEALAALTPDHGLQVLGAALDRAGAKLPQGQHQDPPA